MVRLRLLIALLILPAMSIAQEFSVRAVNTGLHGAVFCPTYYGDSIVVCSNQKDRLHRTILDEHGSEPVDLYNFDPNKSGVAKRFDKHFRTDYNDGPIAFAKQGSVCIVSRNQLTDQKPKALQQEQNYLGLYTASRTDTGWTDLVPLPFNSLAYTCSHPTLNEEGTELIFASNMTGGLGGFDLWKSEFKNGTWSKPVNLGNKINSAENEVFPFQHGNTIYFSSNRNGYGGLDVYSWNTSAQSEALLLDTVINTAADDFGLISKDNLQTGYLSSNRNGEDELFSFELEFPEFPDCDSLVVNYSCYTLFEENAHDLGNEGGLIYQWSINDEKRRGVEVDYCFPGPGDYFISLDVIDTVVGQTFYNQASFEMKLELEVQPYITSPDTVKPGELFALSGDETNLPGTVIDHYFWDFGDGQRSMGLNAEHMFDSVGIYTVQLGISGHTAELKTSDCVYKTIVCTDIATDESPFTYTSLLPDEVANSGMVDEVDYSFTAPDDSSVVTFGVQVLGPDQDIPEGDSFFNLLDSFEVRLEYVEEKDAYYYVAGEFSEMADAYPTWREIIESGFDQAMVRSFSTEKIDDVPVDITFTLENVQFESDRWDVKGDAVEDLNQLVEIMQKFEDLKLDISAYTDASGSFDHNLELSIRRANAVKAYLMNANIAADRLTAKGFGENNPIASNDTKEGKQKNRRVEFVLSK